MKRIERFNRELAEKARVDKTLSRDALFAKIDVDRRTMEKVWSGETLKPQDVTFYQIAEALGIEPASALWVWSDDGSRASAGDGQTTATGMRQTQDIDTSLDPGNP